MDPPVALAGGESAKWRLGLPNDVTANLGISARNGCGQTGSFQGGAGNGVVAFKIPEANPTTDMDPSCGSIGAGYAFAYTTPPGFVATGDPLLEPGDILDVTIVPVYLRMIDLDSEPSGEVVDVARITCDGVTTTVDAGTVAAQADGVHVDITNTSSINLGFEFENGGRNAEGEMVESLAPGPQRVRCFDSSSDTSVGPGPGSTSSTPTTTGSIRGSIAARVVPRARRRSITRIARRASATRSRPAETLFTTTSKTEISSSSAATPKRANARRSSSSVTARSWRA